LHIKRSTVMRQSPYLTETCAYNKSEIMRRTRTITQAEADRTAFWIANAALAVAFLVLILLP
jgi:hypothetical protein